MQNFEMPKTIQVVPYYPNWPYIYEKEARLIKEVLGDNLLEIHHITSIRDKERIKKRSYRGCKAKTPVLNVLLEKK